MSHTDTAPTAPTAHQTGPHPTPLNPLAKRLVTLLTYLTLVLTIALPLGQAAYTHPTPPTPVPSSTHTTPDTSDSPHTTRADKAAAAHDGCRQTSPSSDLLSRPSCRSGMPITHDRGLSQVPPQVHDDRGPVAMNEVPPAWADHWGAAAHSPYHRSQA